jgi:Leucine-rich repeat (LRR) protein
MVIDRLISILTHFSPLIHFDEKEELITRVALNALAECNRSQASLRMAIKEIQLTHTDLDSRIQEFLNLLDSVGEQTRAELEIKYGLADWDGGPNTEEAKKIILNCYLNKTSDLALEDLDLTSLPPLPHFITHLYCGGNKLKTLPNLPNSLKYLSCSCNHLTILPKLPDSLIEIVCCNNKLRTLSDTLPKRLINLNCNNNFLTALPTLPKSLKVLYCNENAIETLPEILPKTLTNLDCSDNILKALPSLPKSLKELFCCYNKLKALPLLHDSLSELFCSNNKLEALPKLPDSLTVLNCSYNKLKILPALQNSLVYLSCSENQIESLPDLPNSLKNLYCFKNMLTTLPNIAHTSITELFCYKNKLESLPNLPNSLLKLHCEKNEIEFLPPIPASLSDLDCSHNHISSLDLSEADDLEKLNCSNNEITDLLLPDFLSFLDCSHNQLTELPPNLIHATIQCFANPLLRQTLIVKFQIPKGEGTEPLWSRVLMNEVRQAYKGEDSSLEINGYRMWGNEKLLTITIKKVEGDKGLIFRFHKRSGLLVSVKDEGEAETSLEALKEEDGWNVILNHFATHILKERGIRLEGNTLKVHPEALKMFPIDLLKMLPSVKDFKFLDDEFNVNPAIDVGGVSGAFISQICEVLFKGNGKTRPLIRLTHDRMPDFKDDEAEIYQKFGHLLSFVLTSPFLIVTGVYFNPKFYLLLKKAISGMERHQLAAAVMKEYVTQDSATLKDLNWYEDPSSRPESKLDVITHLRDVLGAELTAESTDEEICREIETCVLYGGIEIANALSNVISGMNDFAKRRLSLIPDEELSDKIQGVIVTAESFKNAIKNEELSDLAAMQKDWILKKIDENNENEEWLSNFVEFITGQRFLPYSPDEPPIKLKFVLAPGFKAHTCFNMLYVPLNLLNKEEFLTILDSCIQETKNFNTD